MSSYPNPPRPDYEQQPPPESIAYNYQAVYGWGGAPPPPGYGRGRGGMPSWVKVLIITVVVVFGGCGALIGVGMWQLKRMGVLPSIPPAKVHAGTPIQWQELDKWKGGGSSFMNPGIYGSGLAVGNFDKDPQPEIMRLASGQQSMFNPMAASSMSGAEVKFFELDGTSLSVTVGNYPYVFSAQGWDYDGDGTLEIVSEMGSVEVYSATGQLVTTLSGSPTYSGQKQADIDGDGHRDLLLNDPMNASNTIAIGLNGNKVWTGTSPGYTLAWGNVDGDRFAEFIDPYNTGGSTLTATDMKGQTTTLNGWNSASSLNSGSFGFDGMCCLDLDSDGLDEVVEPRAGYLNPKSGKYVSFARPIKQSGMHTFAPTFGESAAVAGDFDGDGRRELAVTDSAGSTSYSSAYGTALVIYRADGSAQYYEEFGSEVLGLAVARDGKRDRLVVLLGNRLLLQP